MRHYSITNKKKLEHIFISYIYMDFSDRKSHPNMAIQGTIKHSSLFNQILRRN